MLGRHIPGRHLPWFTRPDFCCRTFVAGSLSTHRVTWLTSTEPEYPDITINLDLRNETFNAAWMREFELATTGTSATAYTLNTPSGVPVLTHWTIISAMVQQLDSTSQDRERWRSHIDRCRLIGRSGLTFMLHWPKEMGKKEHCTKLVNSSFQRTPLDRRGWSAMHQPPVKKFGASCQTWGGFLLGLIVLVQKIQKYLYQEGSF